MALNGAEPDEYKTEDSRGLKAKIVLEALHAQRFEQQSARK
jgi:hypothetical protein